MLAVPLLTCAVGRDGIERMAHGERPISCPGRERAAVALWRQRRALRVGRVILRTGLIVFLKLPRAEPRACRILRTPRLAGTVRPALSRATWISWATTPRV